MKKLVEELASLPERDNSHRAVREAVANANEKVRGAHTTGSGKWSRLSHYLDGVKKILDRHGISYEEDNDAPRGGKHGDHVRITNERFLSEARKRRKRLERQRLRKKYGTADKRKIARIEREEKRNSKVKAMHERIRAYNFVTTHRAEIAHYWVKKKERKDIKGNRPWSHQSANRLAFRFSHQANVGFSELREAIKQAKSKLRPFVQDYLDRKEEERKEMLGIK